MSISIYNSLIALSNNDKVLIYNLENKVTNVITLPKLEAENEIRAHNRENIETFHILNTVEYSSDGQYFLVCANRKQLCLFRTENFQLISNRAMVRAASRVKFIPNNDIIIADKSGDVYLFSTSNPNENGQLLLGHLSMLLDVFVTDNQKYIITADRDEKIRVSMFPNSYNILSYCLGHKSFVTNVVPVPHDKSVLVSGGGDGTLKYWDFESGKELLSMFFMEKLSQNDLVKLNQILKENDLDDNVTDLPVKHLKLVQLDKNSSIMLVTFYCSSIMLIYNVISECSYLNIKYLDSILLEKEPLECHCYNDKLWVLTDTKIEVYKFNKKTFIIDENINLEIQTLNESWTKFYNGSTQTLLPVLYKRKFDNLQEYQERKKSRLIK